MCRGRCASEKQRLQLKRERNRKKRKKKSRNKKTRVGKVAEWWTNENQSLVDEWLAKVNPGGYERPSCAEPNLGLLITLRLKLSSLRRQRKKKLSVVLSPTMINSFVILQAVGLASCCQHQPVQYRAFSRLLEVIRRAKAAKRNKVFTLGTTRTCTCSSNYPVLLSSHGTNTIDKTRPAALFVWCRR